MLIRIMYPDRGQDMVKPFLLSQLIDKNLIRKFKRSSGWVDVRCDPIRGQSKRLYLGHERRAREQ
ncbi:hypothetical protein DESUT3_21620 [Desulfuromonas versatilis]|uniref:Uncharacterized protein n=1 Tax=Desulfuromonas versatilis TaxID=2802975 RepID=A0ABM8HSZ3_9BACT|nr:hypothetical protein [Desulfuromonas versatilis]BCR05093.1 hypothetical protein DESUT3_21620 [Desulfuromonas versatilis]